MKKGGIISLSIITILVVLTGILFGAVFCLRNQTVKAVGETAIEISKDELINTAGIKKGKSIFMIDKEKAIKNIENKYPYIKVIQIKTTNLTSIEICVRARHDMFYTLENENYYIFDEDLKILNIIGHDEAKPTNLIKIETGSLKISSTAKLCDFVGTKEQKSSIYNLFVAMNTVVTKQDGESELYLTREDIKSVLTNVEFKSFDTFNKLIISTGYGVVLDIENPENNLQNKINICFSTIKQFIQEENNKEKSGTIKIYYDLNNAMQCIYIPAAEQGV
ncbi:MAG: FtsQ-type POTRA domain-containing protein [Clostridia bacterium]|nr:FtsQ-type POTRA domain-containing protein [Clostridia bacterium]